VGIDPRTWFNRLTIGRTFLLWILGVLLLTLVLVSALVLWHERGVLEQELVSRSRLLARTLAVAVAEGGSPEFLSVVEIGDLRAGEIRTADGRVLWRYGPTLEEAEILEPSLLRVEEHVGVTGEAAAPGRAVDAVLLISRARMDHHLANSGIRLTTALGVALALALLVGLDLVGRVVRPLRAVASSVRAFDADRPLDHSDLVEAHAMEVRELAQAFHDMAARLADQRASLATSARRFRNLFSSSPSPLIELDEALTIRGANPAAATFLGCEPTAAVGRRVDEYLAGEGGELAAALAALQPDDEAVVEARWRLSGDELAEVELHLRAAGGPQTPGYLMAVHDLTDRVRRMGERWRRTFDAMMDGVAMVDSVGEIVLANHALSRHLDTLRPVVRDRQRSGEAGEWRLSSDGRLLQCTLTSPQGLGHSILVARDVTDAARSEARLREAEKMQAVGTLASGVAHDFNNLLAAIQLHVRWLDRDPEAAGEAATAIGDLADEGIEVVRELLLFARRESTPPRTVDLVRLVGVQEGVLSHMMPPGVRLLWRLPSEVVPVVGSPVALRRLLLNLVLNARDAVSRRDGEIRVVVGRDGDRAVLAVEDNGTGISAEHKARLFEPFFSLKRHGRGAGLGLAVVYAIITEHGAEIDVESDGRSGSRFAVRFPLASESDLEPLEEEEQPATVVRVILVDDDGKEAARLIEAFAAAGLDVRHATSVGAARQTVSEWSPSAVVSLLELPDAAAAGWLAELRLPSVLLVGEGAAPPDALPPEAVAIDRGAAAEAILAALQRLGLPIVG